MTRRDQQQLLVAELGRSALTGATVARLVADAIAAVAEGLETEHVALFERDGESLVATAALGWVIGERLALDADSPIVRAFRERDSAITESMAVAPVRGEGGAMIGVIAVAATEPVVPDDVVFLRSVANLLAAAMVRERAEERLSFLAEAGHMLAGSLDYDTTLSTLADLVVPRLADWCIIDLVEDDGTLRRVAVRAADPRKQSVLNALHREYPPVPGSGQPAAQALQAGATVQFPAFTPESLRPTTLDERHFELMTELEPSSAIAVPLVAHGRVLGAITFAWSESGRRYEQADTMLAEELGRRAALAIENARLYQSELEAQRRIAFIVEASDVLARSLDYDETLNTLARLAVPRLGDWCVIYIVGPRGSIERRAVEHAGGRQDVVRRILNAH
ncbi:MAG TPA: GAF domain-containing protein, partial [Gaiellaceae bacterium]